jgi:O-acetylhomoserine/O-acetylserine sulfhydrylase-like pyridoxal-dependent enzyme
MAFTGNFMCTSFKVELMKAVHNFTASTGSTFKIALYTNSASFTAATTAYTTSNEVVGTGYTAGGNTLTNITPVSSSTTAFADFADTVWTTATITARGALIYNTTSGNPTVAVLDFGADKTSTAGDFTIIFPSATAADAIIRIA